MTVQNDLFAESTAIKLDLPCADVTWHPGWLNAERANALLTQLADELRWEQPEIVIAGKRIAIPRLQVWSGDKGAAMRYSGMNFPPQPWHPALSTLREELQAFCQSPFNSVLVNLYRDGQDSVSWHADDEYELGPSPVIASLSLGAERSFKFKSRNKTRETQGCKPAHLSLKNGDLVVMRGGTQMHWLHCVPKCDISTPRRINLTFREIRVMS